MNVPAMGADGVLIPSRWGFLYEMAALAKAFTAFIIAVCSPWFLIGITFPHTFGKFINEQFNDAFFVLGCEKMDVADYQSPKDATRILAHGDAVMLSIKLQYALKIYFVFVIVQVLAWLATV